MNNLRGVASHYAASQACAMDGTTLPRLPNDYLVNWFKTWLIAFEEFNQEGPLMCLLFIEILCTVRCSSMYCKMKFLLRSYGIYCTVVL